MLPQRSVTFGYALSLQISPRGVTTSDRKRETPPDAHTERQATRHGQTSPSTWDEASRDGAFLRDLEDVETAFASADAETARNID
jgi:hypothetical protein